MVQLNMSEQCSEGDCIVYVNIAVHAGLLSVAVPADKFKGAFVSCFPEVLFQLAAEVISIREIIVVVNPDRGIVFHRKSLSLTILRLCHQNKEIFREIQVSSMEPDSFLTKCRDKFYNIMYDDNIKEERGPGMKVRVDISADYKEPYAVIYTDKVTDEIQRMIDLFSTSETPVTALQNEEDLIVLQPKEIFMVRVENGETIIYGEKDKYRTRKRLYEIGRQLGKQFMQISRTTLINLSYMDRIEPGFGGTLLLKLRNGCKDYVSRRYLPEFKKYLGL